MTNPIFNTDSQPDISSLMLAILDNNIELVTRSLTLYWKQPKVDPRIITVTALCLIAVKDYNGLNNLLITLDPSFSNNLVVSALKDLVSAKSTGSLSTQNLVEFSNFLDRARSSEVSEKDLGFKRSECPIITELNGDPFWIFADLLPYLWHVVEKPVNSFPPKILAETHHYKWVKERLKTGDVVLDVGANIGLFTNMMSRQVGKEGKVLSFEPNPPVFNDLRRIVQLNQLNNVALFPVAASNCEGSASFNQILSGDVNREASGLISEKDNKENLITITVATTRLDLVVEEQNAAPNLIKIDVEGAEFLALEGLKRTIKKYHPKLVIESHADSSGNFDHARMHAFLQQFAYQIKVFDKNYFCD